MFIWVTLGLFGFLQLSKTCRICLGIFYSFRKCRLGLQILVYTCYRLFIIIMIDNLAQLGQKGFFFPAFLSSNKYTIMMLILISTFLSLQTRLVKDVAQAYAVWSWRHLSGESSSLTCKIGYMNISRMSFVCFVRAHKAH